MIKPIIIILFLCISFYLNFYYLPVEEITPGDDKKTADTVNMKGGKTFLINEFSDLRDTLFTSKNSYIVIDLKTQMAQLHRRDSGVYIFPVSSGNPRLIKGEKTREGLFTIKSKMPQWNSRQFDMTLMLNWMGFNYGIGFHALATTGYYSYLGKRPSSHGCVRISRDDAKKLYAVVEFGTPVFVHNGEYSIWIGFTREGEEYTTYSADVLPLLLKERSSALYAGEYYLQVHESILLGDDIPHKGIPVVSGGKVPVVQKIPEAEMKIIPTIIDLSYVNNRIWEYFDTTKTTEKKVPTEEPEDED
ncbi:MAG: L,D-transpeptidase [Ignavibacteriaceae bacterium]